MKSGISLPCSECASFYGGHFGPGIRLHLINGHPDTIMMHLAKEYRSAGAAMICRLFKVGLGLRKVRQHKIPVQVDLAEPKFCGGDIPG